MKHWRDSVIECIKKIDKSTAVITFGELCEFVENNTKHSIDFISSNCYMWELFDDEMKKLDFIFNHNTNEYTRDASKLPYKPHKDQASLKFEEEL